MSVLKERKEEGIDYSSPHGHTERGAIRESVLLTVLCLAREYRERAESQSSSLYSVWLQNTERERRVSPPHCTLSG